MPALLAAAVLLRRASEGTRMIYRSARANTLQRYTLLVPHSRDEAPPLRKPAANFARSESSYDEQVHGCDVNTDKYLIITTLSTANSKTYAARLRCAAITMYYWQKHRHRKPSAAFAL